MLSNRIKALAALMLIAALALCGCAQKTEPAQSPTAEPAQQPAATAQPVEEGSLTIQEPTATAAPVNSAAVATQAAREIDPEASMIALTFDDGPGAGTRRILRALNEVDGRATFCMVGDRLNRYAETARQVAEQGSEIATHSWDHQDLTKLSAEGVRGELNDSIAAIEENTGVRPGLLRPPYGNVNDEVRAACGEMGLRIVNWNIDTEDWRTRDAEDICAHVLSHAKDGGIVLCHDLYPETAEAMEGAIRELDQRGYQLVTVSELLDARANGGEAGKVYYGVGKPA